MLSIPWWGWLALVVGAVIIVVVVVWREYRRRLTELLGEWSEPSEFAVAVAETAPQAAKTEEARAERPEVTEAATVERRAPRPKRKPPANPKRKKSPARKRKTARGRK